MSVQTKSTFLLKWVDSRELLRNYKNNVFPNIPTNIKKFPLAQNSKLIAPVYGTSEKDPIYSVKDKNNNSVVIATAGYENYELFMLENGEHPPMGGRCDFCKRDFTHQSIGYPVVQQEYNLLSSDSNGESFYKVYYVFWIYGELCSLDCSLSEVRKAQCRRSDYRENLTKNSEAMLHKLHKLMYPRSGLLRPAQDPKLLKINKGSLSDQAWEDPKFLYKKTDRILLLPIKIEYLQRNIY
jgi:hypothetical protein